ncbi:hypothetical protein PR202_ga08187 [Eleusine coracana subsp. coracana]|uniref:Uncharacterized protein n=1 Tax=Eleusine coracana subsp. coracana TaxID=191504 RepID=A0AAV5C0P3_ELECO|nr:hypothetical protein PR202_ga08187 [Eleusine coracana subsp. coracana]
MGNGTWLSPLPPARWSCRSPTHLLLPPPAGDVPSSSPPPPVSDLASLAPLPLIENSSYFRALLAAASGQPSPPSFIRVISSEYLTASMGRCSESGREHVQVCCNLEAAVQVLRYLFDPSGSFTITHHNFIPLLEGALFLAVENLLMECERWFSTMSSQTSPQIVPLDFIIQVWYFSQEHGVTFVQDICPGYLAQNFVENMKPCEQPNKNTLDGQLCLLSKVKICLLPLEFAAGTKIHWLDFGKSIVYTILNLLKNSLQVLSDAIADGTLERYCIRITEYSKKVVLSGCPQITAAFLYISVLPTDLDPAFRRKIVRSYTQIDHQSFILYDELEMVVKTLSFRNVHMVDLSKCPKVHFGAAIDWLKLTFPELKTFRASYCLSFQFNDLQYLLLRCPCLKEVDLTVDTSTVMPRHSVISSSSEVLGKWKPKPRRYYIQYRPYDNQPNSVFSNISRLTLEGRDDIDGIGSAALSQLMSNINIMKFLCLRATSLTDCALCKFVGSCLEYLDVSETAVSMVSLASVIRRNSNLKCLKTAGCPRLLFKHDEVEPMSDRSYGDFLHEIKNTCYLEDVEMGWGFCPILVEDLTPSFSKVRKMTVGLGTTLADNVLHALPEICPFLESLVLRFQVISDSVVRNLLESATSLQECGKITLDGVSSIFNCKALEDVLLRHTGRGIGRGVVNDAVRELPLLRKLALDLCDASEGGYDIPNIKRYLELYATTGTLPSLLFQGESAKDRIGVDLLTLDSTVVSCG